MQSRKSKTIDILGTKYELIETTPETEPVLKEMNGLCDESIKTIIVDSMFPNSEDHRELRNLNEYKNKVIRHEIIHAFLFESGLAECSSYAKDEEMVDWIARQFPKMLKAFQESGCM